MEATSQVPRLRIKSQPRHKKLFEHSREEGVPIHPIYLGTANGVPSEYQEVRFFTWA